MTLAIYTIYDHPADFPDDFVVKRWYVRDADPELDMVYLYKGACLEECRDHLLENFPGIVPIGRTEVDLPSIVECWL